MQPGALSQSEIDALLANISQGDSEPITAPPPRNRKPVKTYNFRRPDKFSKEQTRSLQVIHEGIARSMASTFSARLRSIVQVSLVAVEQGTFDDYTRQIQPNSVMGIVSMEPLPGHMIIELSQQAIFMMLDRLLGGPGKPLDSPRAVTEIELQLVRGMVASLTDDIKEGWRNVADASPRLEDVSTSAQAAQITFATDAIMVVAFEMKILDTSGTISFCLPYTLLEPIISRLSARLLFADGPKGSQPDLTSTIERNLRRSSLPVVASLGTAVITVGDLLNLRVGDVVRLDNGVDGEIVVSVGGRARIKGRPGLRGQKIGIQVTSIVGEEQPAPAQCQIA